jgi:hypothetical protein
MVQNRIIASVSTTTYAVVTADVVRSREVRDFQRARDQRLALLGRQHRQARLILVPYTVTAWDEFQTVASSLEVVPGLVFDLRRVFIPLELRVAVGLGQARNVTKIPINVFAGGEAFERARAASDDLKAGKRKYRVLTEFRSGHSQLDEAVNFIYGLHDTLLQRVTKKQWETINVQMEEGQQEKTARRLRVNVSTVSRNLQRGFFWQMQDTIAAVRNLIAQHISE